MEWIYNSKTYVFLRKLQEYKTHAGTCILFHTGHIVSNKDNLLECNQCRTYSTVTFYLRLLTRPIPNLQQIWVWGALVPWSQGHQKPLQCIDGLAILFGMVLPIRLGELGFHRHRDPDGPSVAGSALPPVPLCAPQQLHQPDAARRPQVLDGRKWWRPGPWWGGGGAAQGGVA